MELAGIKKGQVAVELPGFVSSRSMAKISAVDRPIVAIGFIKERQQRVAAMTIRLV